MYSGVNWRAVARRSARMPIACCSSAASVGLSFVRVTDFPAVCASRSAFSLACAAATFSLAVLSAVPVPFTSDSTWFSSRSSETMLFFARKASTSRRWSSIRVVSLCASSRASSRVVVEPPRKRCSRLAR